MAALLGASSAGERRGAVRHSRGVYRSGLVSEETGCFPVVCKPGMA